MKFSIIVPVYNVEKEIRQCLESIKNQTFGDFEALFVDDCGTDSSMDIVREYAANDERFVIIKQEYNQGVSAARNTALDKAQGEYLVFADSDDWMELNALEVINNAFEKSGLDTLWYGAYMDVDGERATPQEGSFPDHEEFVTNDSLKRLVGCVWNKAFKTSFINENHIRFPVGLIVEDSEFTFQAFVKAQKVYYISDILYNYRKNRIGSLTTEDKTAARISDEFQIINRMYDYLKENDLFYKYKLFLLWSLGQVTKKILFIKHRREYIINEANNLMNRMNFPQDFSDMEQKITLMMD